MSFWAFALPQPREAPRRTVPFHLARRSRVGRVLADGHRARVHGMDLCQGLAEKSFGGWGVPPNGEQRVDRLTEAGHGAIQVSPVAFDLDGRLVHAPGAGAW